MASAPPGRAEVVNVAVLVVDGFVSSSRLFSDTVPRTVLPSMKVTVPIGTNEVAPLVAPFATLTVGVTVAVNVTLVPESAGLADAETVVLTVPRTGSTRIVWPAG